MLVRRGVYIVWYEFTEDVHDYLVPRPPLVPFFDYLQNPFLHTASDQKLESEKVWERWLVYDHIA